MNEFFPCCIKSTRRRNLVKTAKTGKISVFRFLKIFAAQNGNHINSKY